MLAQSTQSPVSLQGLRRRIVGARDIGGRGIGKTTSAEFGRYIPMSMVKHKREENYYEQRHPMLCLFKRWRRFL